ncbi:MAG TPA: glycosyltransferase family 1 protein, partial [Myxococcales bacterium]
MVRGRIHGIARYALELARRLPLLAPDWEFIGLTGPEGSLEVDDALRPSLQLHRCPANYLSIAEQPALLISLLRTSGDLFHATSFSVPLLWRGALVVTLHDANHLALPENYGIDRAAYYRMVVIPRISTAKAVLTVS